MGFYFEAWRALLAGEDIGAGEAVLGAIWSGGGLREAVSGGCASKAILAGAFAFFYLGIGPTLHTRIGLRVIGSGLALADAGQLIG